MIGGLGGYRDRSDSGAVAVEFGIIAPVLILLVLGIMQFGLIFYQMIQVEHAAAEGARYAALRYPQTQVLSRIRASAPGVDLTGSGAVTLSPADPSSPAIQQNTDVAVTLHATVPIIMPFLAGVMDDDGDGLYSIDATARQRIE